MPIFAQIFADPLLLLLLPLPLLALRVIPPADAASGALRLPVGIGERLADSEARGLAATGRRLLPALLWIALVVALAGPRSVTPGPATPASGRDIMLTIDLSGSMEKRDFDLDGEPAQRLEAVKRVASAFVRRRAGDRIGLVVFAKQAYVATPPSYDVESVARAIDEATIGISGRSTAISDGLGLALKRLSQSEAPSRVVILLSDGVNNAGAVDPLDAGRLAAELGVRVHTIALGPHDLDSGERDVVDVVTLRAIAEASGGEAFRVRTTEDLEAVSEAIDAMEGGLEDAPAPQVYRELWVYPAILALMAALSMLALERNRA